MAINSEVSVHYNYDDEVLEIRPLHSNDVPFLSIRKDNLVKWWSDYKGKALSAEEVISAFEEMRRFDEQYIEARRIAEQDAQFKLKSKIEDRVSELISCVSNNREPKDCFEAMIVEGIKSI